MNPGRMNHYVEIQAPERLPDPQAGYVTRWVTIPHGKVWAEIIPMSGMRTYHAMQLLQNVTHEIVTWYIPGVDANNRIKYGDRIFRVKSVFNNLEQNSELHWMCEESTP